MVKQTKTIRRQKPLRFVEEQVSIVLSHGIATTRSSLIKKTFENVTMCQMHYFEVNLLSNMGLGVRVSALL